VERTFVLITIKRNRVPGQPRFQYPAVYNAAEVQEAKRGPLVYDSHLEDDDEETTGLLVYLDSAVAERYASDPGCKKLTQDEASAWLGSCRRHNAQPVEVVTNASRLQAILAKQAAGVKLSTEDKDAVNPAKSVPGIERRPVTLKEVFGL